MPCTTAQLNNCAKWRNTHREKYREVSRISHKKNYNSEKENARVKKYYYFKKECKRLSEILLD